MGTQRLTKFTEIADNSALKRVRFHVTHQGGGGNFELTSPTTHQSFVSPVTPPDGVFYGRKEKVNTLASGGGVASLSCQYSVGELGTIGASFVPLVAPVFPDSSAQIYGNSDITQISNPSYYGGGGSFDGKQLKLAVDRGPLQTVTFVAPVEQIALIGQINAQTTGLVASMNGNNLLLTADSVGYNSAIEVIGVSNTLSLIGMGQQLRTGSEWRSESFGINNNLSAMINTAGSILSVQFYGDVPLNTITAFDIFIDFLYLEAENAPLEV